ncbi:MAG: archaeosortase/exosortase family protein [Candidatus Bathyarchaeota archaeon]|nr:MAG: archaeosortase/exosortase family protein [Candidatus Bathyarchaeota archaeon]
MLDIAQKIKENISILEALLPILSFVPPILVLHFLHPESFQTTYQGRTLQLFFLWLVTLEAILTWERTRKAQTGTLKPVRTISLIISLLLPTVYVFAANYCGLNITIMEAAMQNNVPLAHLLPLATEYLIFAFLFASIILLTHGKNRFVDFSIPLFFLVAIGVIFTIDDLYPYGWFTPFQILVPATATLAANVLNLMGYQTHLYSTEHPEYGSMPHLSVWNSEKPSEFASFGIAWPCAGVESLVIYTVTILLFMKRTSFPWRHRIVYFVVGAAITYVINIFRVVAIFVISMSGGDVWAFHNYYGWLYSVAWILSYPLKITGGRILWRRARAWKAVHGNSRDKQNDSIFA